jgi:hypothetical protein
VGVTLIENKKNRIENDPNVSVRENSIENSIEFDISFDTVMSAT